ncbi:hypothetical protein INS49_015452 [Diaporthe citri]|uniref:uncharacterized protein n=1 Tax=Diaporthe citri TaxID=83186 RepID=UPI001C809962|nr:uncharacterized protein INS49_015452 [Diaporthe citri]KAG6356067.1 hypothetical protein INS49_015452 [Diaporthe citri]
MSAYQSPKTGNKRKRPSVDSERPYRPTGPQLRLSSPRGHRNVQAMAQNQSMPFLTRGALIPDKWEDARQNLPGNDNLDGTLSIIGTRSRGQDGCVDISRNPRSSEDRPPDALQPDTPSIKPSQKAAPGVASSSGVLKQSHQIARPIAEVGDRRTVESDIEPAETTADAAYNAYTCLGKAHPKLPYSDVMVFLSELPSAEGALDINSTPQTQVGRTTQMVFELPRRKGKSFPIKSTARGIARVKAALAQSHGIVSERERNRSKAGQEASGAQEDSASPHRVGEDRAKSVSADGQNSQDPMHNFQDLAIKVGLRARKLPPEEQQATLERVESLLAIDGLELDELDMARCILESPIEQKIEAAQMMLRILRPMLSRKPTS